MIVRDAKLLQVARYKKENVQYLSYLCLTALRDVSGNMTCWMKNIQLL